MDKKEWQREKRKGIACLVVGLVGTLLGSVLIFYLWDIGWFYQLSVDSKLSFLDETEIEALMGVALLLPFLTVMFHGFMRVQIDLRCEREYAGCTVSAEKLDAICRRSKRRSWTQFWQTNSKSW